MPAESPVVEGAVSALQWPLRARRLMTTKPSAPAQEVGPHLRVAWWLPPVPEAGRMVRARSAGPVQVARCQVTQSSSRDRSLSHDPFWRPVAGEAPVRHVGESVSTR